MPKAAVVIGVNKTGKLPVLSAAVSGARNFATWLAGQGFDVRLLTDEASQPVTSVSIANVVTELVDQGTLEQLVVYFAGHGFLHKSSEFWLLSGAPRNPNEAINVAESVDLARECGIPNVVFVSDACRSTADSLQAQRVAGSLIFPNDGVDQELRPEVDRFFAALPGNPALEIAVDESSKDYEGVFTRCFLRAYQAPDDKMVRIIRQNGGEITIVPNRALRPYLRREVESLLRDRNITVRQAPDAIVESGDEVYLGQVARMRGALPVFDVRRSTAAEPFDLAEVAQYRIASVLPSPIVHYSWKPDEPETSSPALDASIDLVRNAQGRAQFETQTGFTVLGTTLREARGIRMGCELIDAGPNMTHVRVNPFGQQGGSGEQGGSVLLRFREGSGTVLAALEGYIGTVVVEAGQVVNVSYVPSQNSWRWHDYSRQKDQLEALRANVAAAASHGVFRVPPGQAKAFADEIRYLKSIDPTLGLYACYAYSDAGKTESVLSVLSYMDDDLRVRLFDVRMLAGPSAPSSKVALPVVPFAPMLSQGWALLRARHATVPPAAREAGDHMLGALWSTFDPAGMDILGRVMQTGGIL